MNSGKTTVWLKAAIVIGVLTGCSEEGGNGSDTEIETDTEVETDTKTETDTNTDRLPVFCGSLRFARETAYEISKSLSPNSRFSSS